MLKVLLCCALTFLSADANTLALILGNCTCQIAVFLLEHENINNETCTQYKQWVDCLVACDHFTLEQVEAERDLFRANTFTAELDNCGATSIAPIFCGAIVSAILRYLIRL